MTVYETVIGMEFHAELKTRTKLFCSCPTTFTDDPNTHICPICLGLPGTLPVLNGYAVELAVRAGMALDCRISRTSKFDRKNYFYPDLPGAYQITQFPFPICKDGHILIESAGGEKKIRINRIHMEEDAGKLVHSGDSISSSRYSMADYNRGSTPLIEIVTEPDMSSASEAVDFAEKLKLILEYAGVSDVKMEQGSLRCDVNISLRPEGADKLGTKTEIKNLNSFRAVERAIRHEESRQAAILDAGGRIEQETRSWDDAAGVTLPMRSKENAQDYRYFPEPNLAEVTLEEDYLKSIAASMREMPRKRKARLMQSDGLSEYDAGLICGNPPLALFYDEVLAITRDSKTLANWLLGDFLRLLSGLEAIPVKPADFAALLKAISDGRINNNTGKAVLEEMFKSGASPDTIIAERGFGQISDSEQLSIAAAEIIKSNPKSAEDYRAGKTQAIGALIGQVMKKTGGQANPQMVREILIRLLDTP